MYKKEFEKLLESELPRSILMYGGDGYFLEYYTKYYKTKLNAQDSMLTMYHDEYSFDKAKAYLSQGSLFGGSNLLVIKTDKKVPKKELEELLKLVQRGGDNYLLYIFLGDSSSAKAIQNSFTKKNGAIYVRFFDTSINEAISVISTEADNLNVEIDRYAIAHLYTLLEGNLLLCVSELPKLALLPQPVTTKDIDKVVYSTAPLAIEKLLIELFEKRAIGDTLSKLLEMGEDELQILRATQRFVQQLLMFHTYIRLYGKPDPLEILGYRPPQHIVDQKANLAIKIKSNKFVTIANTLIETELLLKRSKGDIQESLLYGMFIRIQGLL